MGVDYYLLNPLIDPWLPPSLVCGGLLHPPGRAYSFRTVAYVAAFSKGHLFLGGNTMLAIIMLLLLSLVM